MDYSIKSKSRIVIKVEIFSDTECGKEAMEVNSA